MSPPLGREAKKEKNKITNAMEIHRGLEENVDVSLNQE